MQYYEPARDMHGYMIEIKIFSQEFVPAHKIPEDCRAALRGRMRGIMNCVNSIKEAYNG